MTTPTTADVILKLRGVHEALDGVRADLAMDDYTETPALAVEAEIKKLGECIDALEAGRET